MRTAPFKTPIAPGDLLVLAREPWRKLRFKGMGHDGEVIATWEVPPKGRPLDVIVRQREVLRVLEC